MAIVTEDGTGLTDAVSFTSVAFADDYATLVGNTEWGGFSTAVKEARLVASTRFITNRYGLRWFGRRKTSTQSLPFPRTDIYDLDGFYVDENSVPTALQEATVEMAFRAGAELQPDISPSDSGSIVQDRIVVGPIELETRFAGSQATTTSYPKVNSLLENAGLVASSNRSVRG